MCQERFWRRRGPIEEKRREEKRSPKVVSAPVRLKVSYKSPQSLMGELTRSVGRGGVRVESRKPLPVGTSFVFELRSAGVKDPVEITGTVASVSESAPGKWVLHIRYEQPRNREGLDAVIGRILEEGHPDSKRRDPRVPLRVRAVDEHTQAPGFRLRDISKGGVGIDVEGSALPSYIHLGCPFGLQMKLTQGVLSVEGEVIWTMSSQQEGFPPRLGVQFSKPNADMQRLLEELLALKAMPSPPWIARLRFGEETRAAPAGT
jgi:hypothetical protein